MDDRAKEYKENAFWNKKMRRALEVTDVDKDGLISRRDFELIVERQKEFGVVSDEKSAELRKHLMGCVTFYRSPRGSRTINITY